jgi:hypothetical protein
MLEHKLLEIVSQDTAREVAAKDAPSMSTDVKEYVHRNALSYYIAINTWLLLVRNFSPHAWMRLTSLITERGLITVIKIMQDEALRIIKDEDLGPWAKVFYADIRHARPIVDRELFESVIGLDDTATVLFLLRYLKRFSPQKNDVIQRESLKDFLQYENRTKLLQRSSSYGYWDVVHYVRQVVSEMYDWEKICREIDNIDPAGMNFSSGAAANSRATTGDKVMALLTGEHEEYFLPCFGTWMVNRPATRRNEIRPVKVLAVPKSYKASRIIAMDDVFNLAMGMEIEHIFRNQDRDAGDSSWINLEDQTINQKYAQHGSEFGDAATLDASHASDLISKSLFVDLFPVAYVTRVMPLLPQLCEVEGTVRSLQMASTSGNTLTFRHETIVYRAVVTAAERYYRDLVGPITSYAWAYGDDAIVNSAAADIAVYFFSRLGLIINTDKSYAQGPFRESCGKDYLYGTDVSSIYYPRFPIIGVFTKTGVQLSDGVIRDTYRGKIENSLTMLIDLQKKLFPYSYDAARFIASIVQQAYPITSSVAGAVCTDLWDYVDGGKPPKVPLAYTVRQVGKYLTPRAKMFRIEKSGTALDNLSDDRSMQFRRALALDTLHSVPRVAFVCSRSFTDEEQQVFEYWRYIHYLRYGSTYDNELDRLLGIPSKPITISQFFGITRLEITLK